MGEATTGPCAGWIQVADLPAKAQPDSDNAEEVAEAERAIEVASDVLYALSGRQFAGLCSETLTPCPDRRHAYRTHSPSLGWPYTIAADWRWGYPTAGGLAWCYHGRRDRCSCVRLHTLDLGLYPLVSVDEIVIGGDVLDESAYRVDDDREIVRLDGKPWPPCADLTDPDAFTVTVTYGIKPPPAGEAAAATLAAEVYLARIGSDECRLPKRVQNITRQGISMAILDPFEFLDGGRTGLYDVDLFLAAHNPNRLSRRPAVLSPDLPRRHRRIDT